MTFKPEEIKTQKVRKGEKYTKAQIRKAVQRVCSNKFWKHDPNLSEIGTQIIAQLKAQVKDMDKK